MIQVQCSATVQTSVIDAGDFDATPPKGVDLPGAGLSHEQLTVAVIPEQVDEFTCGSCFLVRHRFQLDRAIVGTSYCTDCQG